MCALSDEKRCDRQCFTCSEDEQCDKRNAVVIWGEPLRKSKRKKVKEAVSVLVQVVRKMYLLKPFPDLHKANVDCCPIRVKRERKLRLYAVAIEKRKFNN